MPMAALDLAEDLAEKKMPVSSYISAETWAALNHLAREKDWSISQYIRKILEEHVTRSSAPRKKPKS
jgi:hypothetical protein